ncbi:MAG: lipid-A-disaccharide synthase [Candidatus Aminicenantes bacterium]|nr:lipid-A-disaccharide synthase [Candidatus Aminicenantes bacterium]
MTDSLLIIAGEKSGENYGAEVVRCFRALHPGIRFFGIGGTKMAAEGVDILVPMDALAVVGLFEVISHLPRIRRIFNRIRSEVETRRPAAAVLIDSPDFNLRLAKKLHRLGVPVLYYIGPTVWAWRKGRLKTVKKYVREMCLIFPFEEDIYRKAGVPARFVGHPLLERVRAAFGRDEFLSRNGMDPDKKLIVIMPGSRRSEIRFHMPVLVEALKKIRQEIPAQFVFVLAENLDPGILQARLPRDAPDIKILGENAYEAMAAADLVLSACGTANLETALLETPLIAFYRLSSLTYKAGVKLVKVKDYSIVNILAGKRIVAELIQRDFTADNLVREVKTILGSEDIRSAMKDEFRRIKSLLGRDSASANVAGELDALIRRSS